MPDSDFRVHNTKTYAEVHIAFVGSWRELESQPETSTGAQIISKKPRRTGNAMGHIELLRMQVKYPMGQVKLKGHTFSIAVCLV